MFAYEMICNISTILNGDCHYNHKMKLKAA